MDLYDYSDLLLNALKNLHYSVITDSKGLIRFMSNNYKKILNVNDDDIMGIYIENIVPNTEVPRVLNSRKEEIGYLFKLIDGRTVVCNRIPIFKDEKLLGVICSATFSDLYDVSTLSKQIEILQKENLKFKERITELSLNKQNSLNKIIGENKKIVSIKNTIQKFAESNLTFLITGETGTGKEVFSNAVHELSKRRENKFVKINCASIPKDLLESELFGYEPGSFTGASEKGKIGKLELANKGTVLLDEIGDMPLTLQSKLLRVLQENEIEKIGGLNPIPVDIRVICSTNQDLENLIEKGLFRRDLYYRINVVEVNVPPLRKRLDDLPLLCEHFIKKINDYHGLSISKLDDEVFDLFRNYNWKGNVRELEHVLERAAVLANEGPLNLQHFDFLISRIYKNSSSNENPISHKSLNDIISSVEKEIILKALIETNGNKTKAAKLIGIDRGSLYNKLKKYRIE